MIKTVSKTEQLREFLLQKIALGGYSSDQPFPSVRDLCREFGVCKQTASQALISLRDMGLLEISHGKSTILKKNALKKEIQLCCNELASMTGSNFALELLEGIHDAIRENPDYSSVVRWPVPIDVSEWQNLRKTENFSAKGILLIGSNDPRKISAIQQTGIPYLTVYQKVLDNTAPYVSIDLKPAINALVNEAWEKGYRQFGYIGLLSPERGIDYEKFQFFQDAIQSHDEKLSPVLAKDCEYDQALAYQHMKTLLALPLSQRPQLVFLSSDTLCMAAYRAALDLGLSIPADVAIVGCDNLESSQYMSPALTTIDISRREIGRAAVAELMRAMEEKTPARPISAVVGKLIPRESM